MKKGAQVLITATGLVLAAAGLYMIKHGEGLSGLMRALPYVCVGAGCGAFGHGMGDLIGRSALKRAPDLRKQMEIEQKDERNLAIMNRAKGRAYDAMVFIFGALIFSLALMNTEMSVILLLVFGYLLVVGISVYYRCKYDREM
jgi:hypothetical protein